MVGSLPNEEVSATSTLLLRTPSVDFRTLGLVPGEMLLDAGSGVMLGGTDDRNAQVRVALANFDWATCTATVCVFDHVKSMVPALCSNAWMPPMKWNTSH